MIIQHLHPGHLHHFLSNSATAAITIAHFPQVEIYQFGTSAIVIIARGNIHLYELHILHSVPQVIESFFDLLDFFTI